MDKSIETNSALGQNRKLETNLDGEFIELDWLSRWNLYSPEKTALVDGDSERCFTYSEFFNYSKASADYLQKNLGVKKGDRVASLATNEIEFLFLFFGLQRLGAIFVPINFRLSQREVNYIVGDARPKVLFYGSEFRKTAIEAAQEFNFVALPLLNSDEEIGFSAGVEESLKSKSQGFEEFVPKIDDECMILYTSGTTGFPKGATLSYKTIFWNSLNTSISLNLTQTDCAVIFLPFFHTGGWNVLTTPMLHRGAKLVFLKKFDAGQVLQNSALHKATLLFGVPTTMDMMAQSSEFKTIDLSTIRFAIVGGEPMPMPLIEKWHSKGVSVRQGYGLTEFGPNVFSLRQEDSIRKIGSIGFPNFYIDVRVINEKGKVVGANQVGELQLRGPMSMKGYWNNPKATSETIVNGWLNTGDLVKFDEEGYFYVVGRKKDMYISGAENVYPAEIEQVLRKLKGVREAAVIGVPDEKWGEVGKVFISCESGISLKEKDIIDYCVANMAKFKVPKYVEFLDELPKGDSGKILKKNLK